MKTQDQLLEKIEKEFDNGDVGLIPQTDGEYRKLKSFILQKCRECYTAGQDNCRHDNMGPAHDVNEFYPPDEENHDQTE